MATFFRRLLGRATLSEEVELANQMVLGERWPQAEAAARSALKLGDRSGSAATSLAIALANQAQSEEARTHARAAADVGHAAGMYVLHQLLFTGAGGLVDHAEARRWCERAAELGYPRACFNLGAFYASGTGGFTRDTAAARGWYEKAGELGVVQALVNLGMMLAFEVEPPERDVALLVLQRARLAGAPVGALLVGVGERLLASDVASATWALAAAATFDSEFAKVLTSPSP